MRIITLLTACLLPALAAAQTPQSIIDTMRDRQLERWEGVETYTINQTVMGSPLSTLYRRTMVDTADGGSRVAFLPESVGSDAMASMDLGASERYAGGLEGTPFDNDMQGLIDKSELVGTESINGREAYHLRASNLEEGMDMATGQFSLKSISVWIDTDEYVPLEMTMDGVVAEGGQSREANIVMRMEDYRPVPGSRMYESFRQTMTMSNVMSDADRAEMEKARVELEKFERQMAAMPESQRKMMESMMGGQLNAMRNMISDDGLNIEVIVESIEVQ